MSSSIRATSERCSYLRPASSVTVGRRPAGSPQQAAAHSTRPQPVSLCMARKVRSVWVHAWHLPAKVKTTSRNVRGKQPHCRRKPADAGRSRACLPTVAPQSSYRVSLNSQCHAPSRRVLRHSCLSMRMYIARHNTWDNIIGQHFGVQDHSKWIVRSTAPNVINAGCASLVRCP